MYDGRYYICFDTEATGLTRVPRKSLNTPQVITQRGSEVCQIGGLICDMYMRPMRLFCYYCDTVAIGSQAAAFRAHGIDSREVRSHALAIFLPEIMERYLPEFFAPEVIFVGYNAMFDMEVVEQTLANSAIPFTYKRFFGTMLPKSGRHVVDVAEYVKIGSAYRKLTSFDGELREKRDAFLREYSGVLDVETNCLEMLEQTWQKAHNSFFDSLNTYLLWGDKVWKKKVL